MALPDRDPRQRYADYKYFDMRWGDDCLRCQHLIKFVPLSQIEIPPVRVPERIESLRQIPHIEDILLELAIPRGQESKLEECVDPEAIPQLSSRDGDKYRVGDGIHRVNLAKELGLPGVLARVEECFTLRSCDEALMLEED